MNKRMTIGVDLAKHSFAVVILGEHGREQNRKTWRRNQLVPYLAKQAPGVVAMEACASAHYWGRTIKALGHDVTLLPAQHVKGYLRSQKNDYNDALAIAEACQRLQAIPGFGPVVASVVKHWMGDGQQFGCGREASAALGLVPRQHSTGGKERLGGISKRGDAQIRALVVHGARAIASHAHKKHDALSLWIQQLKARRGMNKAIVALANKLIRIAWVIIARGEAYRAAPVCPG